MLGCTGRRNDENEGVCQSPGIRDFVREVHLFPMALLHLLILAASIAAIYYAYDGSRFSLHPVLMVAGALLSISETYLVARAYTSKIRHAILSHAGVALVTFGFLIAFLEKGGLGAPGHFESWHSWVGGIAVIASICTAVGGSSVFYLPYHFASFFRPFQKINIARLISKKTLGSKDSENHSQPPRSIGNRHCEPFFFTFCICHLTLSAGDSTYRSCARWLRILSRNDRASAGRHRPRP